MFETDEQYKYNQIVDTVEDNSLEIEELGAFIIGEQFLVVRNPNSQSGAITSFVLVGMKGGVGVYKCVYQD